MAREWETAPSRWYRPVVRQFLRVRRPKIRSTTLKQSTKQTTEVFHSTATITSSR